MTLITPNGVFLIGVIDGAPVYTAWSRRVDPQWLADQLNSVPSKVRGPGCAFPAVVHATGESLSTPSNQAERPAQDAAAPTAAGSDVHEGAPRTPLHADPSAGGDNLSLTSPPMSPVRLSLAAFRRIRRWLA